MSGRQVNKFFHRRRSGVLLHPTSLPTAASQGALGADASRFIDFLAQAGFSVWQMLPVHPPDKYGSPYQSSSVHAGDPQLINLQKLSDSPWMEDKPPQQHSDSIAYAHNCFKQHATEAAQSDYRTFQHKHSAWLDNYALYCAIKETHHNQPWWKWPEGLRWREQRAVKRFQDNHAHTLDYYRFEQYLFFSQWHELRSAANDRGILLLGDMPIFTAHDSVGVWAHPGYFLLDESGQPTAVAGVPPDYFSPTGQRWGNPLYVWSRHQENHFQWWVERIKSQLELYDLVRLDHFRGFLAQWEIPANSPTAEGGAWRRVPGRELLQSLKDKFGELPLIAEDLGIISEDVVELREDFNLPGMKVLQFAFDSDANNPYLPHNHDLNSIVYTGTHDNNTTLGWFNAQDEARRQRVNDYLRDPNDPMPWPLIHTALQSVCPIAVLPMQDLLGLDESHRMNTPGTVKGNWRWKFEWEWLKPELIAKLHHLNSIYGRI